MLPESTQAVTWYCLSPYFHKGVSTISTWTWVRLQKQIPEHGSLFFSSMVLSKDVPACLCQEWALTFICIDYVAVDLSYQQMVGRWPTVKVNFRNKLVVKLCCVFLKEVHCHWCFLYNYCAFSSHQ